MKACFVCHSARGLAGGHTGGAERQVALLARSFVAAGHEASFVVPGLSEEPHVVDGVRLLSGWDPDRGAAVLRAFSYRVPHLRRVLADLDADLYYVRGSAAFTPVVMWAARAAGAVSLLGLANDRDLTPEPRRLPYGLADGPFAGPASWVEFQIYLRGAVRAADWVVTQHRGQDELCARLGVRHVLIPNIVALPPDIVAAEPQYDAVWVGNVHRDERRRKGLDEFVALTGDEPGVRFAVAGGFTSPDAKAAVAVLERRPNVAMLGVLDHRETLRVIAASRLVVNTSAWEGLSNVMLEGWGLRRPSLTLNVDPNGLLSGGRLGATAAGDTRILRRELRRLLQDDAERAAMGARAAAYVAEHHSARSVVASYETLMAAARPSGRRPR